MIVPLPPDPDRELEDRLLRDTAKDRVFRALETYRQAVMDQYVPVYQYPSAELPADAHQMWVQPHGADSWQHLGYTSGPILGLDFGQHDPEMAVAWPFQDVPVVSTTVEVNLTDTMHALFDALLSSHRADLERRLHRLAEDLGRWVEQVRHDFDQVLAVLEAAGIADGYGRLTVTQPVRPPVQVPAVPRA
ncbi:hypothetical protein [Streptomyces sp. bgisy034]|uniref:hypothetical protein n=1 Tax=Streptomyces sp. bgisy034 TaxID=3413774 RepID=UPI003EBCAD57